MTERKKRDLCFASAVVPEGGGEGDEQEGWEHQPVRTTAVEKLSAMRTAEYFAERGAEADIEAARRLLRRSGGQPPDSSDRLE